MNWVLGLDQWSRRDLRNKWCSWLPCASYPQCVSFWQEAWSSPRCSAWEPLPTVAVCVAAGWKLSLCVVFHDPTALTEAVVFWVLEVCSALAWSPGCCCSGFSGSFLVTGLGFLEPIRGGSLFSFSLRTSHGSHKARGKRFLGIPRRHTSFTSLTHILVSLATIFWLWPISIKRYH